MYSEQSSNQTTSVHKQEEGGLKEKKPEFFTGTLSLNTDEDISWLNSWQIYQRTHLYEVFSATEADIAAYQVGHSRPVIGQVGLRCIHCKNEDPSNRARTAACFPNILLGLHTSAGRILRRHNCTSISPKMKAKMSALRSAQNPRNRITGSAQKYWAKSATKLGLAETPQGIFFVKNPTGKLTPHFKNKESSGEDSENVKRKVSSFSSSTGGGGHREHHENSGAAGAKRKRRQEGGDSTTNKRIMKTASINKNKKKKKVKKRTKLFNNTTTANYAERTPRNDVKYSNYDILRGRGTDDDHKKEENEFDFMNTLIASIEKETFGKETSPTMSLVEKVENLEYYLNVQYDDGNKKERKEKNNNKKDHLYSHCLLAASSSSSPAQLPPSSSSSFLELQLGKRIASINNAKVEKFKMVKKLERNVFGKKINTPAPVVVDEGGQSSPHFNHLSLEARIEKLERYYLDQELGSSS